MGRDETGDFAAPWHLEFCQILRVRSVREHFAWGFPMIFMMSNLIVRDESYKSHGTTRPEIHKIPVMSYEMTTDGC